MSLAKKPLAGPGYIILNVLRVLNIIGLTAVMVASWIMLVKTFVISKFFFFDAISHVITSCISMFLVVSELTLFKSYYARNWPLFSPKSGFVTLGLAMIIVGVSILGNLNKQATSQESLGLAFWRIVIASGIIVAVLGFANITVSYVFCDKVLDVTARQIRAHGAQAAQAAPKSPVATSTKSRRRTFHKEFWGGARKSMPPVRQPSERETRQAPYPRIPVNISRPTNVNPHFKDYVVSPVADVDPSVSNYDVSEASDVEQHRPYHPAYAETTDEAVQRPAATANPYRFLYGEKV
ncbi:MAG: hypothetical protein M1832_000061 [Thelocarpon impressellum]|nr:MAG: hypothetical protein M1832_000061 [Thelocarpon impressellum]